MEKIYALITQYSPVGAPQLVQLGSSPLLYQHARYNGRLQLTNTNNGNVLTQVTTQPGAAFSQTYNYDQVNRLCTVREQATAMPLAGYSCTGTGALESGESWRQAFGYDATGNQTTHGGWTLAYDAEGRIKTATPSSGNAATYEYDADGRRVKKTVGTTATWFVYDVSGQLAAEYTVTGPTGSAETHYLTTDHLGSTRLVTNQSATVVSRHDYLPFGEEVPSGLGGRTLAMAYPENPYTTINPTQRFTGKERDAETRLGYFEARFHSSLQHRFTSADPNNAGASLIRPQSWNAYAYVLNNPLNYVDPDGNLPIPVVTGAAGLVVGGAVGGGAEAIRQWSVGQGFHSGRIWTATGGGALAGLIGGATLGVGAGAGAVAAATPFEVAMVSGSSGVIGGVAERAANEQLGFASPAAPDEELQNRLMDFAGGAVFGWLGGKLGDKLFPIPNVVDEISILKFAHRRSTRAARISAATTRAERVALVNSASAGLAGSGGDAIVTDPFVSWHLRFWLWLNPSKKKDYEATVETCFDDGRCVQ